MLRKSWSGEIFLKAYLIYYNAHKVLSRTVHSDTVVDSAGVC